MKLRGGKMVGVADTIADGVWNTANWICVAAVCLVLGAYFGALVIWQMTRET
jgi:hypothetical protein